MNFQESTTILYACTKQSLEINRMHLVFVYLKYPAQNNTIQFNIFMFSCLWRISNNIFYSLSKLNKINLEMTRNTTKYKKGLRGKMSNSLKDIRLRRLLICCGSCRWILGFPWDCHLLHLWKAAKTEWKRQGHFYTQNFILGFTNILCSGALSWTSTNSHVFQTRCCNIFTNKREITSGATGVMAPTTSGEFG